MMILSKSTSLEIIANHFDSILSHWESRKYFPIKNQPIMAGCATGYTRFKRPGYGLGFKKQSKARPARVRAINIFMIVLPISFNLNDFG
jgi:hypothetical protein